MGETHVRWNLMVKWTIQDVTSCPLPLSILPRWLLHVRIENPNSLPVEDPTWRLQPPVGSMADTDLTTGIVLVVVWRAASHPVLFSLILSLSSLPISLPRPTHPRNPTRLKKPPHVSVVDVEATVGIAVRRWDERCALFLPLLSLP